MKFIKIGGLSFYFDKLGRHMLNMLGTETKSGRANARMVKKKEET